MILQFNTVRGRPAASVAVHLCRGYWRVAFDSTDVSTLDGRWCLAEVIDWCAYQLGKGLNEQVILHKRIGGDK